MDTIDVSATIINKSTPIRRVFENGESCDIQIRLSVGITLIVPKSNPLFKVFNAAEGPSVGDRVHVEIEELEINVWDGSKSNFEEGLTPSGDILKKKMIGSLNKNIQALRFRLKSVQKITLEESIPGLEGIDLSKQATIAEKSFGRSFKDTAPFKDEDFSSLLAGAASQ